MNIKHLDALVKERIDNIIEKDFEVVIGDADGADTSIQSYLFERGARHATVFCSGGRPRNNVGEWTVITVEAKRHVPGTRAFYTVKDVEMARRADIGLMIWDTKSTGTLSNVLELLRQRKKSVVFVNKLKRFVNVGDVDQLEHLVELMTPVARTKADAKIGLTSKLGELRHEQSDMFAH
jgi:hypothetical protein